MGPNTVRRTFSTAFLLAWFEFEWYANYVPDPEDNLPDVGLEGVASHLGIDLSGVDDETRAKGEARQAMGAKYDAALGLWVHPETGVPV